jgi:hypothetical protein
MSTMPQSIPQFDDDVTDAIRFLFVAGFLLLCTTLLQASLGEGYPLEQLGAYCTECCMTMVKSTF